MEGLLLLAILLQDATPTQTADHAVDLAVIGAVVSVLVALIGAWGIAHQNARTNRANARIETTDRKADSAKDSASEAKDSASEAKDSASEAKDEAQAIRETLVGVVEELQRLRNVNKRRDEEDALKEARQRAWRDQMEAHGREQDALIAELQQEVTGWREWGERVLALIKALPDGATIEGQLPPMPMPQAGRQRKRKGEVGE